MVIVKEIGAITRKLKTTCRVCSTVACPPTDPSGELLFLMVGCAGAPNWFYAHAALQLLAGVLFVAGIAYAMAEFDSQDIPKAHKEVGVVVLALWVVQIAAAVFRPDNHGQKNFCVPPEWRAGWLMVHRAGFLALMVLAACNCVTGAMVRAFGLIESLSTTREGQAGGLVPASLMSKVVQSAANRAGSVLVCD